MPNPNNGTTAFLNTIQKADKATTIAKQQATGKFADLFKGLDTNQKRVQMIEFGDRLLKAVKELPQELQGSKQDVVFLSKLTELSGTYATLNPVTSTNTTEPINFFLDTLWSSTDNVGIQKGIRELGKFLTGINNPGQVFAHQDELIDFFTNNSILKQQMLGTAESIAALFTLGRYNATLQATDEFVALQNQINASVAELTTGANVKSGSNPEVDAAISQFRNSADGGPDGTDYWKNVLLPLAVPYQDLYVFFIEPLSLHNQWRQVRPLVVVVELQDGTVVTAYPLSRSGGNPTLQVGDPQILKMRYLPLNVIRM